MTEKQIQELKENGKEEEYIIKQYIYNTKDFETIFNRLSNNQFNTLANKINIIYKYDK